MLNWRGCSNILSKTPIIPHCLPMPPKQRWLVGEARVLVQARLAVARVPIHSGGMKPSHSPHSHSLAAARARMSMIMGAVLVLAGSCSEPASAPVAVPPPVRPAVAVAPVPRPAAISDPRDWHNAPLTPGVWRWRHEGGDSVATFGTASLRPLVALRCRLPQHAVLLEGAGAGALSIVTTTSSRAMPAAAPPGDPPSLGHVQFAANDPLLDAIAFSRGRFAVEREGMPPLVLPTAPELSRVIEDCRADQNGTTGQKF